MSLWIKSPRSGSVQCCDCRPNVCSPCECNVNVNVFGNDSGFSQTFDTTGNFPFGGTLQVSFDAYTLKDRLYINSNGVSLYDSGCINGSVTPTVNVAANTNSIDVMVQAHCAGETNSTWNLIIACTPN